VILPFNGSTAHEEPVHWNTGGDGCTRVLRVPTVGNVPSFLP
jgi:hypothetical protein